jgi:glutamyl-tRNA synthetase
MLGFLFSDEIVYDEAAVHGQSQRRRAGRGRCGGRVHALGAVDDWTTPAIDAALRSRLIEEMGLKPRHAFGPVRVALTGKKVSPPLFESLELLGREESLRRLHAAAKLGAA